MSTLTVLTQNIWGGFPRWQHRMPLLRDRLAALLPEVVGLQEVHTEDGRSQAHEIAPKGYRVYFAPGRRYGLAAEGIALLVRGDARAHEPRALTLDSSDRFEGRNQRVVLAITIDHREGPIDVFVTHLSLSRTARTRTAAELIEFVDEVHTATRSIASVVMGDLNAEPSEPAVELLQTKLTDAWRATRGEQRGGTWPAVLPFRRLDYVFTRGAVKVEGCKRIPYSGSDHLGLLARLSAGRARARKTSDR